MASTFTELVLVARSAAGRLQCMKYDLLHGWSSVARSGRAGRSRLVALASFARETQDNARFPRAIRETCNRAFARSAAWAQAGAGAGGPERRRDDVGNVGQIRCT